MKFHLLSIGNKFTYKGTIYIKNGPLTGVSEINGENKMIPRSAHIEVYVAEDNVSATNDKLNDTQKVIPLAEILDVMNVFYQGAVENLKALKVELNEQSYSNAVLQLENYYKNSLKQLS